MAYDNERFNIVRRKQFYTRPIAMLLVGIMQDTQLLRKYRIVGYGGRQL